MIDLEAIEAALAAMTPGRWLTMVDAPTWDDPRACGYDSRENHRTAPFYCTGPRCDTVEQAERDSAGIVLLRNNGAALVARVRELTEQARWSSEERATIFTIAGGKPGEDAGEAVVMLLARAESAESEVAMLRAVVTERDNGLIVAFYVNPHGGWELRSPNKTTWATTADVAVGQASRRHRQHAEGRRVMLISRIVSGAQSGVDIAALRAAKSIGITTGGTMPKGYRTLDGARPEYAAEFGLVDHASTSYPPRTYQNVRDAHVTVRIALDFTTAGERCTAAACAQYRMPPVDIGVRRAAGFLIERMDVAFAAEALKRMCVMYRCPLTVNFAGNSERTAPGIERFSEAVVVELIATVEW